LWIHEEISALATLRILSAGAAQAVTERIIDAFKRDTGHEVVADFGAVGAMKKKFTSGERADVITLTQPMIEELIAAGLVQPGSRFDLGKVGTGVAVRAGTPLPDVSSADALRARILSATRIVCPDPAVATAGKVVMAMLDKLGVADELRDRLQFFPNGYAAMAWLAQTVGTGDLGITQVTEILPNKNVAYAGPLPEAFQMKAVYSVGLASKAPQAEIAKDFIARFSAASSRSLLVDAGYELS
jgi:molybdate transport system substrate-binding protein